MPKRNDPEPSGFLERSHRYFDVHRQLMSSDDRSAAVLCGAFIDTLMKEALKSRLIYEKEAEDYLFKPEASLGNFGARTRLGLSLGLYTKKILSELNLLSSIRNDFAHRIEIKSFDHDTVKSKVMSLKLPLSNYVSIDENNPQDNAISMKNYYVHTAMRRTELEEMLSSSRNRFMASYTVLANILETCYLNPKKPEWSHDPDAPPHRPSPSA